MMRKSKELEVTVHGKVISRIVPEPDAKDSARQLLAALRAKCKVGDVVSSIGETLGSERWSFLTPTR